MHVQFQLYLPQMLCLGNEYYVVGAVVNRQFHLLSFIPPILGEKYTAVVYVGK